MGKESEYRHAKMQMYLENTAGKTAEPKNPINALRTLPSEKHGEHGTYCFRW